MPGVTFTTRHALQKSALRQANDRVVLNLIRQNPRISRADLVRITGLAPSSITFIVKRLRKEKLVAEEKLGNGENRLALGRQPTALRLCAGARVAVGIEIDSDGARIMTADLDGKPLSKKKTVPRHASYEAFFEKVQAALSAVLQPLAPGQVLGVGVALPGTIDRSTGRIVGAENLGWFGVEAGALLRRNLPIPFYFENGAKLSALAEMWFAQGDAPALHDFVSVIARGGIGTGVIVNGQLLQGAISAGGEFGHIALYPEGRRCPCGHIGCWEQYASDLALSRAYAEESGQTAEESAENIIAKARANDRHALKALETTARYVGMGFANLVMALNPQAIIVGDYLADAWDLIENTVWSVLKNSVPAYELSVLRIYPSRYRSDAPLMGALALVLSRFFSSFDQGNGARPSTSVLMQEHA